jgi:hypothetical protein
MLRFAMQRKGTAILALVAAALTIGVLWYVNRPVIPTEASWEDVKAEAQRGGYQLINTEELAKLYQQPPPNFLLVDTRQDWEYRSGHMKGAVNFPMEPTWWSQWRSQGRMASLLGPDKGRLVVFY